jgi:sigma-B regulation protein RsbU (phosphoserine phosphatase)
MIETMLEPAREVGGDLADHFQVGDDLLVLAVGDVSDKGAGAAMMMARTHTLLRSLSMRPDAESLFRAPEQAVGLVNAPLAKGNSSAMFVTFLLACIDITAGTGAYVRAGHVPPFLRRATGSVGRLSIFGGLPLGVAEQTAYKSGTIKFAPGDRVLIVTDGYTEAENPEGTLFGAAAIESYMAKLSSDDPAPLATLTAMVRSHEAGRPASDDMAAVLLSFDPSGGR